VIDVELPERKCKGGIGTVWVCTGGPVSLKIGGSAALPAPCKPGRLGRPTVLHVCGANCDEERMLLPVYELRIDVWLFVRPRFFGFQKKPADSGLHLFGVVMVQGESFSGSVP